MWSITTEDKIYGSPISGKNDSAFSVCDCMLGTTTHEKTESHETLDLYSRESQLDKQTE